MALGLLPADTFLFWPCMEKPLTTPALECDVMLSDGGAAAESVTLNLKSLSIKNVDKVSSEVIQR